MKSLKGNKKIEELLAKVREEFNAEEIVESLKEIREIAREEKNPALVKICRLCYTYIEDNGDFDIEFADDEDAIDMPMIEYLLELMLGSEKEANKEEIREIRDILTTELYG
ncbi:MAG: hypothetical protein H6607_12285 [Flavobacteriales bacterium]|nr:hypothetical protein [Flavobacteriales bacterium]